MNFHCVRDRLTLYFYISNVNFSFGCPIIFYFMRIVAFVVLTGSSLRSEVVGALSKEGVFVVFVNIYSHFLGFLLRGPFPKVLSPGKISIDKVISVYCFPM